MSIRRSCLAARFGRRINRRSAETLSPHKPVFVIGVVFFFTTIAWGTVASIFSNHSLPRISIGYFLHIEAFEEQKEYELAIDQLKLAFELDPVNRDHVSLSLGALLIEQGQFEEAKFYLERTIPRRPEWAAPHVHLATVLDEQGVGARQHHHRALKNQSRIPTCPRRPWSPGPAAWEAA